MGRFIALFGVCLLFVGCVQSEEKALLGAVKKYRIDGKTLESLVEKESKAKGGDNQEWETKQVDEGTFEIKADIEKVGQKKPVKSFTWKAKRISEEEEPGRHYKMKPTNKPARKLNRIVE